jgi:hypothetical protein
MLTFSMPMQEYLNIDNFKTSDPKEYGLSPNTYPCTQSKKRKKKKRRLYRTEIFMPTNKKSE